MEGDNVFVLGGRRFVQVGPSTMLHDTYFWRYRDQAGLDAVAIRSDEDAEAFARRLVATALKSPATYELMGTLLVPEGLAGESWTPDVGHETARHIESLTDEADKQQVFGFLNSLLIDFFVRGISSLMTSPRSSSEADQAAPATTSSTRPIPTDAGAKQSEQSPATTMVAAGQ